MIGMILLSGDDDLGFDVDESHTRVRECWYSTMNRSAASSFSVPRRPAVARPMPLSNISRSYKPNASSSSPWRRTSDTASVERRRPAARPRQAQLRLTTATEHFRGRDEDLAPRRGVLDDSGRVAQWFVHFLGLNRCVLTDRSSPNPCYGSGTGPSPLSVGL